MNTIVNAEPQKLGARILTACRFLLVLPVIGCVLLTTGVVIMGMGRILTAGVALAQAGDFSAKAAKTIGVSRQRVDECFFVSSTCGARTAGTLHDATAGPSPV